MPAAMCAYTFTTADLESSPLAAGGPERDGTAPGSAVWFRCGAADAQPTRPAITTRASSRLETRVLGPPTGFVLSSERDATAVTPAKRAAGQPLAGSLVLCA